MPVIYLTKGQETIVDSEDFDLVNYSWYASFNKNVDNYYAGHTEIINGRREYVWIHRIILERILNRKLLSRDLVDHIDHNTLNNVRSNLRLANYSQNASNSKKSRANTSGFKGVIYNKNRSKWMARIKFNQKLIYIGLYSTPELAHEAYCKKAKELFGEFANFG